MVRKLMLAALAATLAAAPAAALAEAGGHQYGVVERCVRAPWGQNGWWWQWVPCNSGAFNLW